MSSITDTAFGSPLGINSKILYGPAYLGANFRVIMLWYCSGLNYSQMCSPISKRTWRLLASPCFLYRLWARVNPLLAASIMVRHLLIKSFAARTLLSVLQASGFINQAGAIGVQPVAKKNGANPVTKWTLELYLNSLVVGCFGQSF